MLTNEPPKIMPAVRLPSPELAPNAAPTASPIMSAPAEFATVSLLIDTVISF